MGQRLRSLLSDQLGALRYEPTAKRIRGVIDASTVLDSAQAALVWEPRRVVPEYAVPEADITAEIVLAPGAPTPPPDAPILTPAVTFDAHTSDGERVEIRAGGRILKGLRLRGEELDGYVLLDFTGADTWLEEDEPALGHPRDPFHRVDTRTSSREIVVSRAGQTLARSSRPRLVFETNLPVRYYLPRADVLVPLEASSTRTLCAYKGEASYWTTVVDGERVEDIAWEYLEPLEESIALQGFVAFYDDKVDVMVDGRPL